MFDSFITNNYPLSSQFASESLFTREDDFFFNHLPNIYKRKLNIIADAFVDVGFDFAHPDGAYYILARYSRIPPLGRATKFKPVFFTFSPGTRIGIYIYSYIHVVVAALDSTTASTYLIENVGVAGVPGKYGIMA